MGCLWVGAAVVVIGVISSLHLRVEAQETLEKIGEAMKTTVEKLLKGGYGLNETCDYATLTSANLDLVSKVVGKSGAQIAEYYREKGPGDDEGMFEANAQHDLGTLKTLAEKQDETCSIVKQLDCEDRLCVECSKAGESSEQNCKILKEIEEATHKRNGGDSGKGSGGGWRLRPVDGALLAALLALFALSA